MGTYPELPKRGASASGTGPTQSTHPTPPQPVAGDLGTPTTKTNCFAHALDDRNGNSIPYWISSQDFKGNASFQAVAELVRIASEGTGNQLFATADKDICFYAGHAWIVREADADCRTTPRLEWKDLSSPVYSWRSFAGNDAPMGATFSFPAGTPVWTQRNPHTEPRWLAYHDKYSIWADAARDP